MKNISNVMQLQQCSACKLKGFFCYTPCGADYITCPCCGEYDYLNVTGDEKYDFLTAWSDEIDDMSCDTEGYFEDMRYKYRYCSSCKIMFETGCTHNRGGCTSDIYNAHFIKKWKNKLTNIEYDGMPQFEDTDDWFANAVNVEVIENYCPHRTARCVKTSYAFSPNYCCPLSKKI